MTRAGAADDVGVLSAIDGTGVVAILRGPFLDRIDTIVAALAEGGIRAIEISLTAPDAYRQIASAVAHASALKAGSSAAGVPAITHTAGVPAGSVGGPGLRRSGIVIGAGTVRTVEEVRLAHACGATFLVSPVADAEVIAAALDLGIVPIPGVFTPTEAAAAMRWGAPAVKLFPASVFNTEFVRDLLVPMPELKLVPTGGITVHRACEFAAAGAWAVGVGSPLLAATPWDDRDRDALVTRARTFVDAMRPANAAD